jgi:hypothetical protein
MTKIILIATLLVSSFVFAQEDPRPHLKSEYENSTEPVSIEDFDGVTCAYAHGVDQWSDQQIRVYTRSEVIGVTKGRGPRYPGKSGEIKEAKFLATNGWGDDEDFIRTSASKLFVDGKDLVWDFQYTSGSGSVSKWNLKFRRSGAYINFSFLYTSSGGNSFQYYGYCWHEKKKE